MCLLMFFPVCLPLPLHAWEAPRRGFVPRAGTMDALRSHAERVFDAPLVFVAQDLRVEGDAGFAMFGPRRPDGRALTRADLLHPQGDDDPFDDGSSQITALLQRSGETWVAMPRGLGCLVVRSAV